MHPDTKTISEHMKWFGLNLLGHALQHTVFSNVMNHAWNAIGVVQTAHAAEILVKAAIAQEHPLLIFEQVPKAKQGKVELLTAEALLKEGRTLTYPDLPDRLWAATGYRIADRARYKSFGLLRNQIQHLTQPEGDLADEALRFTFRVIEPLIFHFWQETVLSNLEDPDTEEYLVETLDELRIKYRKPKKQK